MNTVEIGWIVRRMVRWLLIAAVCGWGATSFAASSGKGQAYGVNVGANLTLAGAAVQLGDTGLQSAPPDFDVAGPIISADIGASLLGVKVLGVTTGVITNQTQSTLAQNRVVSNSSVDGLNVSLVSALGASLLNLGANTITSTAQMACVNGIPAGSGSATIVGGTGLLSGVAVNPGANTGLNVLGVASVLLNEQSLSPDGKKISVNAIHISINVLGLITADIVVGHSEASITDCKPTVTLNALPAVTSGNQSSVPISGTCSAGSGNVAITSNPAGATQSLACLSNGTYSGTLNMSGLPDGSIMVTATQTASGFTGSDSKTTTKNTAVPGAPTVAVTSAPAITAGNQASYGVSGTCSANGVPVSVSIGGVAASTTCSGGTWSVSGVNVSGLPDGSVTVTASQTVGGLTGQGSLTTSKSTAPQGPPVVTVGSAPTINAANQTSYSASGTCSANGVPVTVTIGSVSTQATCSGGTWSVSGVNVSSVGDGPVTVTASQTVGGQTGSGTRATTKDAQAPTVAVTTAPTINAGNQSSYGVSGTCSENGRPVSVSVGSVSVVPAPTCSGGAWSVSGVDVGGLASGPVTVTASQTDAAGNTGSGTRATTKESAAAAVTVTGAPPINASNQSSYGGVTGTCSAAGGAVTVAIGSVTTTTTCNGGTWSVSGVNASGVPDGTVTITATQTISGAPVSGSRTTVKDVTPPAVTITNAPTIDATNQSSYTASGTCTTADGAVTVAIGNVMTSAPCINGSWTVTGVNVGGLPQGPVTIKASQTDAAGNTGSATRQVDKTTASDGSGSGGGAIAPQNGSWIITAELNGKPGRGMGIDVQNGAFVMQVYDYTTSGAPTFHLAIGTMNGNKVVAPLKFYKDGRYFGSGPRDGQEAGDAGNVEIVFTSRTTGTIKFPGEDAKAMQRFDYEGTPADRFADPAFVDRWAMVELDESNQPVGTWWADIGASDQVSLNYNWALSSAPWPYAGSNKVTVHGFDGSLGAPLFAQCDYTGADRVFACSGNSASTSVVLRLQRSVDQLVGSVKFGTASMHRIIGARITRAAYTTADGKTSLAAYFRPDYAPEAGTWIASDEITGKPGRGFALDLQKPVNSADHTLFMSIYDYESNGNATFHSVLGAHVPSTVPAANRPSLAVSQYQGGRYFGSGDLIASYLGSPGNADSIRFATSALGTIKFPGEDPVQIERYYFGVDKNSIDSLVGSWVVLAHAGPLKSRIFRFTPHTEGSVIDMASGYVCVKEQLLSFSFRCDPAQPGAGNPVIRFATGYYAASRGIEGDGGAEPDATPELTVMRITDPDGRLTQSGSMFLSTTPSQ
ncbi:choice-of-anchor P family protein [Comamonas humi]